MLGPMVNPAFPQKQLVGVFSLDLARIYGYIYQNSGKDFVILHSLDGYDEISLTGPFKSITHKSESLINPEDLGLSAIKQEDIFGGTTVKESAEIFKNVLTGKGTEAQTKVVATNAAFALQCYYDNSFDESYQMALDSINKGKANQAFERLIESSKN